MPDKYELFLDKNKKVKLAADDQGNFFAEANGNRIKLGDDGLQKFGAGGVLEDIGGGIDETEVSNLLSRKGYLTSSTINSSIREAAGTTKTFSFSQENMPTAQLKDTSAYNLNFRNVSSFTDAIDGAFNYASNYGYNLGQKFIMDINYELELNFGWEDFLQSDPNSYYYPDFRMKKRWSSVTADEIRLVGRFGSIAKTRYNRATNAGLNPDSSMADMSATNGEMFYKKGGYDYTNQYGMYTTQNTDPGWFNVPSYDKSTLVPQFELMARSPSPNYPLYYSSSVGSLSVWTPIYTGFASYFWSNEIAANIIYANGGAVSYIMNTGFVSGSGGSTFYRSIYHDGQNHLKGNIKVTLI